MRRAVRQLRTVLDRRTKLGLVYGTVASAVMAGFDMLAIALVLPLVSLASGEANDHFALEMLSRLVGTTDRGTLTLLVGALVVGLFIAKDLFSIGFVWWMAGFKAYNRVRLSSYLLRYYLRAPFTETAQRSSADLMRTMGDGVIQVYGSVAFSLMSIISGSLSILAIVVALLLSAPLPTLALLLYLGLATLAYVAYMRPRTVRAGEESAQAAADAWRTALGALGAKKESKLRSSDEFFVASYEEAAFRGARAARHAEFIGTLPRYLLEILFILGIGVILIGSTSLGGPQRGSMVGGVGMVALFVAAGFRVLPTITQIVGAVSSLRFGMPYLDLVHSDIVSMKSLPETPQGGVVTSLTSDLRVEHVSFTYPGGADKALRDVSLCIPAGSSAALVGGSGAGKSTLVDVILGLHQPDVGRVSVDGLNIADDLQGWQQTLGYVPQDVFLLDGSLAENIAFDQRGDEIDRDLVSACIEKAQLGDMVEALPNGVDAYLGERGSRLSGGQRQRVGIARALYRQPTVLVLDEATSALDNETEYRISQAVQSLAGDVTVIVVAHRLSTVKNADQVVLMRNGQVVGAGHFRELREKSTEFDRLVRLGSLDS